MSGFNGFVKSKNNMNQVNLVLGVKVMSYLLGQQVSRSVRKTFHQTQLELSGKRHMLSALSEHFHEQIPRKH